MKEGAFTERLTGPLYQSYEPRTQPETARALFVAKYGYQPDRVLVTPTLVLAGPIYEEMHRDRNDLP